MNTRLVRKWTASGSVVVNWDCLTCGWYSGGPDEGPAESDHRSSNSPISFVRSFRRPLRAVQSIQLFQPVGIRNSESAYHQGYKEGLKTGRDDGRKAKGYDPERSHYFHDAGFGNFAEVYRQGFSTGYREGYRGQGVG